MVWKGWGKPTVKVLLAAVLAVGLCPASALGASSSDSDVVNQVIEQNRQAFSLFQATGNEDDLMRTDAYDEGAAYLPSANSIYDQKFDLRDKGVVSPVKIQSPWGTCWSFGATAAIETSLMTSLGINVNNGDDPLDLSELHTAWFSYTPMPEDSGSQATEGNHPLDAQGNPSSDSKSVLDQGGFPFMATSVYSSGIGPMTEELVPYKNKESLTTSIGDQGDFIYSEEGDWSVDESQRFGQVYELEASSVLPTPAGRDAAGNYEYNDLGTTAIKQELNSGRAVEIAFSADTSRPDDLEKPALYINTTTWAHYTWDTKAPVNHAVTIVGWDDTYSQDNFLEEHKPPHDGAWIVKNSWGSNADDVKPPHHSPKGWGYEGTGYFYLSYYDMSISLPESFVFDTDNYDTSSEYYIADQYDFMPSTGVTAVTTASPTSMANVFTAGQDQIVRTLSCETANPNTEVTYQLYLLNEGATNPNDGTLLAEKSELYSYGGYHRVSLGEGYRVNEGERYSIVVTERNASGYSLLTDKALNKKGVDLLREAGVPLKRYAVGIVNEGESFTTEDGGQTWKDWTESIKEMQDVPLVPSEPDSPKSDIYDYDNFALKAYSDPVEAEQIVVPDLTGKTEAEAATALQEAGLTGQATAPEYSDTVAKDCVMAQSPAAGTEVEEGTAVSYTLSLGKKTISVAGGTSDKNPGDKGKGSPLASTGDATAGTVGLILVGLFAAFLALVLGWVRLRSKR